jgi:hypothetical protein
MFNEVVDGARFTKVLAIFAFGTNANDETKQLAAMIRKAKEKDTLFILLFNCFRNIMVNAGRQTTDASRQRCADDIARHNTLAQRWHQNRSPLHLSCLGEMSESLISLFGWTCVIQSAHICVMIG